MSKSAAYLAGLIVTTSASAAPVTLTGAAIRDLLTGRTLNLDTPLGSSLPVALNDDGSMTGKAGDLGFYLGSAKDQGKWRVKGSKLCLTWQRWLDGAENCMRIKRDGEMLSWVRDDGMSGTAKLMPDVKPKPLPLPAILTAAPAAKVPAPFALGGPRPDTEDNEPASLTESTNDPAGQISDVPPARMLAASLAPTPPPRRERIASLEPDGLASPPPATSTATKANRASWAMPLRFGPEAHSVADLVRDHALKTIDLRWCHEGASMDPSKSLHLEGAASDGLPGLFIAAASTLRSADLGQAPRACAGALPTLQELAKLLIATPQPLE